jgi:pyruvate ferredoxin oxidoreductase delta subunit
LKLTVGAVVRGGTSLNYRTGSWRNQRPVIQEELCTGCGMCETVCPDSCVVEREGAYLINYEYCKGCGLCAHECPSGAIEMVAEGK